MTYKIEIHEGLVLLNIDGLTALVDTGSTKTFSRVPKFKFAGSTCQVSDYSADGIFRIKESNRIINFDRVSASMGGRRFDILLGNDILSRYMLTIDMHAMELRLNDYLLPEQVCKLAMNMQFGVPKVLLSVGGCQRELIIDIGANKNYLFECPITPVVGAIIDYNPMIGDIRADLYEVNVSIGNENQLVKWGYTNIRYFNELRLRGIDGLFGSNFLILRIVTFDFRSSSIWIG